MSRNRSVCLLLFFILSPAPFANADAEWRGIASSDWSNPINWDGFQVPGSSVGASLRSSDSVNNTATLSRDVEIPSLHVFGDMTLRTNGHQLQTWDPGLNFNGTQLTDDATVVVTGPRGFVNFDLIMYDRSSVVSLSETRANEMRMHPGTLFTGMGTLAVSELYAVGTLQPAFGRLRVLDITPNSPLNMNGFGARSTLMVDDGPSGLFSGAVELDVIGDVVPFEGHLQIGEEDRAWFREPLQLGNGARGASIQFNGLDDTATLKGDRFWTQSSQTSVNVVSGDAVIDADFDFGLQGSVQLASNTRLTFEQGHDVKLNRLSGGINSQVVMRGNTTLVGSSFWGGSMVNEGVLVANGNSITMPVVNYGTLEVGSELSVSRLTMASTSVLDLDIQNGSPFVVDGIVASSQVDLAGELRVDLNGSSPNVGDQFTIISAPEVTGTFDSVRLPELLGRTWDVQYSENSVVLEVATGFQLGDFDLNGVLNCLDVDSLVATIVEGLFDESMDLTGDGIVNQSDFQNWLVLAGRVNVGGGYRLGDANLDGFVDVSDFNVWNDNKFTSNAAYCSGDFNADGQVDVSDFNYWNQNKFTASDVVTPVPEPSTNSLAALSLTGLIALTMRRQRKWLNVRAD